MDEELRELEQTMQKTVSVGSKVVHTSGEITQPIFDAAGNIIAFPVKQTAHIISEHHAEKKAQKAENKNSLKDKLENRRLESFTFTGKDTDLCYFQNTDRMPLSAIDNITDSELRQNVVDTFDKMCSKKNGLVRLEGDEIVITEKGKQLLKDENFVQRALNDQLVAYDSQFKKMFCHTSEGEQQFCAVLNGDGVHDFTFFYHSDNLNLREIAANPNKELREQIAANINQWKKEGLVDYHNGVASLTEKGKEVLNKSDVLKQASKRMLEKPIDGLRHTSDSVIVTTKTAKKAVQQTAQQTAQLTAQAADAIVKKIAKMI